MKIMVKISRTPGVIVFLIFFFACVSPKNLNSKMKPVPAAKEPIPEGEIFYIDAHNHLFRRNGPRSGFTGLDYDGAAMVALTTMDKLGIKKILIMPPPFHPDHPNRYDIDDFIGTAKKYSDRFSFLGGGGTLNVMIHQANNEAPVPPKLKRQFEERALEILLKGAIGFGEFAVEHFSLSHNHPYESVPADHPLLLFLADIASKHGVSIDIHMEAVPKDMPLPNRKILTRSGRNPKMLRENISAFKRLLAHNKDAKIIWAHAGWCNTGYRTPELCRNLLTEHPNLYMSFKLSPESMTETRPISRDKRSIRPEWLQLIQDFPERFIIGTDQFYVSPGSRRIGPQKAEATRLLMKFLPSDLAHRVGIENPVRLFSIDQ